MNNIIIYVASLLLMILLDYLWLGIIAGKFFSTRLGDLMTEKINWPSAFMFYLVFTAGILIFAVFPAVESENIEKAILLGAFLGVIAYGTYEFTNHSFIKNWPLAIMPADILWGAFVSGAVSFFAYNMVIWMG